MTMPFERTRALRWAGEFLREIRSNPDVDQALRNQAIVILRHYPEPYEIRLEAEIGARELFGPWLAPEPSEVSQLAQQITQQNATVIQPAPDADLLVLAGDIHVALGAVKPFKDWPVKG